MSDLVGNPEDRFSSVVAHMLPVLDLLSRLDTFVYNDIGLMLSSVTKSVSF